MPKKSEKFSRFQCSEKTIFGRKEETVNIPLAFAIKQDEYCWAWIRPNLEGTHLPLLDFTFCHTCQKYFKFSYKNSKSCNIEEHLKICRLCVCGCPYLVGSTHEAVCSDLSTFRGKKIKKTSKVRKSKVSEAKGPISHGIHFADFETFSNIDINNGAYTVYAAGLLTNRPALTMIEDSSENNHVIIFYGKDALDQFMWYCLSKLKGVLWFYNGSRFDNVFVHRWLVEHEITIENAILGHSSILSLEFKTDVGTLTLKDLNRFLIGSLDANCKSFKISVDEAKGQFDHGKMTTWAAVEAFKDEVCEYLAKDCLALGAVYRAFAKIIFDNFKIHVPKYLTSANLAMGAWTSNCFKGNIYGTPKKYEAAVRSSYRGGRIYIGQATYFSESLDDALSLAFGYDGWLPNEFVEEIEDYAIYTDVNSLYPYAQSKRQFPVGHMEYKGNLFSAYEQKRIEEIHSLPFEKNPKIRSSPTWKEKKNWWKSSLFCVDIIPPKDILYCLIMSRTQTFGGKEDFNPLIDVDEGSTCQDLHPKLGIWLTGTEIWEAVKWNYKVETIHAQITWEKREDIFSSYVEILYKLKKKAKADGDGALEATIKLLLNGLTGKFGQKVRETSWQFVAKNQFNVDEAKFISFNHEVKKIIPCYTDWESEIIGYLTQFSKKYDHSSFPIELSSFILGASKEKMGRLARKMGGSSFRAIYGDTDSFIILAYFYKKLAKKYCGKELGQLKDELNGGKVLGVLVLAPKTYMVLFTKFDEQKNQHELRVKMRCKGIPHYDMDYPFLDLNLVEEQDLPKIRYDTLCLWLKQDSPIPNVEFKQQKFIVLTKEQVEERSKILATYHELSKSASRAKNHEQLRRIKDDRKDSLMRLIQSCQFLTRLTWNAVSGILDGSQVVECLYPIMNRLAIGEDGWCSSIGVTPNLSLRTVNKADWWKSGKLHFLDPLAKMQGGIAYPNGHQKILDKIAKDKEEAQRLMEQLLEL